MNDEIQGLFKSEGVNPASGCLPILVQMPVFLSFFYLLRGAPELWHAPWLGWIQDLSAPDPIYVLPILMGVTQFLSTKMMPAPPNPTQRIIMNTFPTVVRFHRDRLSVRTGSLLAHQQHSDHRSARWLQPTQEGRPSGWWRSRRLKACSR